MRSRTSLLIALVILATVSRAAPPAPYGATPTEAQLNWHGIETYAFCHFTTNTFTDKEWGYGDEDPRVFNPSDFDADQIVGTLARNGFGGVILTCKHHDGFCLWPTKTTDHNITKSPWRDGQGDVVREFADAARRHGIKFGTYLSPWDRNHASYGTPEYIKVYRAQLKELLTNYGEVFEVWFDGANGGDGYYGGARERRHIDRSTYYDWPTTWKMVNEMQPGAIIFSDIGPGVRWIGNEHGHANYPCWATYTPQGPDGKPPGVGQTKSRLGMTGTVDGKQWLPGECDVSIRPGWFWHENQNDKVRSPQNLVDLYFKSVGRGASFLLNVPPNREGKIDKPDVESLAGYGEAMKQLFSRDYAEGAHVSADITRPADQDRDYSAKNVLVRDRDTYWATPDGTSEATLTLELPEPRTFDVVRLREPVQLGQRVRKFEIDVRQNGEWIEWVADGSSIGAQVLFRRPPVTANGLRVRFTECAACPCLSEVSLWKLPDGFEVGE